MRSEIEVFNEWQEIRKPIIAIFVLVRNLEIFVWTYIFIHIYRSPGRPANFKFSLPARSNKVKNLLKHVASFDISVKLYDRIDQIFNTAMKFMWNPNPEGNYRWY